MINAMRAYLQTEGQMDYRDCAIAYYTYTMFETPNKYRVNVNVHIQLNKATTKKTLNIDESFDSESAAINYGIEQGKKFIDMNYENGKIVLMSAEEKNKKSNLNLKQSTPNMTPSTKQQDAKKK